MEILTAAQIQGASACQGIEDAKYAGFNDLPEVEDERAQTSWRDDGVAIRSGKASCEDR